MSTLATGSAITVADVEREIKRNQTIRHAPGEIPADGNPADNQPAG